MKIRYIIFFVVMMMLSLFVFTGCANEENLVTTQTTTTTNTSRNDSAEKTNSTDKETVEFDYKAAAEKQMAMPKDGETIAIIKIKNHGEVKVKFFDQIAPKAVENFTTHAKNGYYDGLTFHRVINEFMIQGGDPEGTGMGGESIWGTGFGTELSQELVPYRGSLCMAMSQLPNSIGSQFFITQANYSEMMEGYLKQMGYPTGLLEQYKTYGGYLSLYLQYTVFGQVYEGMDVIDSVAKVQTNEDDKPLKDVVIESIKVTTFKGE